MGKIWPGVPLAAKPFLPTASGTWGENRPGGKFLLLFSGLLARFQAFVAHFQPGGSRGMSHAQWEQRP
jgi:hypothetical protein